MMNLCDYCRGSYEFIMLDTVDSTNTYAKRLAEDGARENTVVISRRQSCGRGRLGRSFFSDTDGIYMSVILRPRVSPEYVPLITTAAAVAVSAAIDEVCGEKTGIKWVNDIFLNGKKICGILTEGSFEHGMTRYAVLGIGINLCGKRDDLPEGISDIAGFIYETEYPDGLKEKLIAKILENFSVYYKNLTDKAFLEEYRRRSILIGRTVECISADNVFSATVTGIDDNAGLMVKKEDGSPAVLSAGEVSLRL